MSFVRTAATLDLSIEYPHLSRWLQDITHCHLIPVAQIKNVQHHHLLLVSVSTSRREQRIAWLQQYRVAHSRTGIVFWGHNLDSGLIAELLEMGAEDVLDLHLMSELQFKARVRCWIRRFAPPSPDKSHQLGQLEWQHYARRAVIGTRQVQLRRQPAELLQLLLEHQGRPVSRQQIITHLWKTTAVSPNVIDAHVSYLRRQIFNLIPSPTLTTLYGYGYQLSSTSATMGL